MSKNEKYTLQFLPSKLSYLTENKKILYKNINLKTSYIIDIIHTLLLKYFYKKSNSYKLSSLILKERYGKYYNYYIDYLIDNKIIYLFKQYKVGKNARIYAFYNEIIKSNIIRYKNTDKILLKRYNTLFEDDLKDVQIDTNNSNKYPYISDDIKEMIKSDLGKFNLDYNSSFEYLNSIILDKDVYNRNLYSIESIHEKNLFCHFDNYGRVHTNFTILKSYIRKNYLTVNGNKTYEKDISNSQPRFLLKLLKESNDIVNINEVKLFEYLVLNGLYYQYLIDKLRIKKKDAKTITFKILFGKNHKQSKLDILFSYLFPTIHLFIKKYKKRNNDYRSMAHILQKMESNLIFNKIFREIKTTFPHIEILTIHDSIIVDEKYKDIVNDIFDKLVKIEFGE